MSDKARDLVDIFIGGDLDDSDEALAKLMALPWSEACAALLAEAQRHGWRKGVGGLAGWLMHLHLEQTAREIARGVQP